jgi:hypothetical protein
MAVDIALILPEIGDVDDLLAPYKAIKWRARLIPRSGHWVATEPVGIIGFAMHRYRTKILPFPEEQITDLGLTDTGRVFQHCVEYRLQLAR